MNEVILKAGGQAFRGWKDVSIQRDLRSLAGSFSVSLVDSWKETDQNWVLAPYTPVEVFIDELKVLTGFVDSMNVELTPEGTSITVAGRDKTGDLIDCASTLSNNYVDNVNLSQLTKLLVAPYGIEVVTEDPGNPPFPRFEFNLGATVASTIEHWARFRGLLIGSDEEGRLVIRVPGSQRSSVDLIEGQNLKSVSFSFDTQRRFSDYLVLSQIDPATAKAFAVPSVSVDGRARDAGVGRFRQTVLVAEQSAVIEDSVKRAQWEATTRAAASERISVELASWKKGIEPDSELWRVNELVGVSIPSLGIKDELLVSGVTFSRSVSRGTIAMLTLERKDAFIPEPVKPIEPSVFGGEIDDED